MRKSVSIFLAIILVAGSFFLAKKIIANKKKPKAKVTKIIKTVFTQTVNNSTVPIIITSNGNLMAKNRIELYAEVQGVLEKTNKDFKQGISYKKGETIIKLNAEEFYANLQAQKSNLFNVITAIMPDIRLDYPQEYSKWQAYLIGFDKQKETPKLPVTNSQKEKFFISGRGINTTYFAVKNLEVKLDKYTLKAPFNGVLTETLVNPGTLIRAGQKFGEFIDPSIYEMGMSIKSEFRDLLQVGKAVTLHNIEKTKTWKGKVVRINGKVDVATQTITAFIEVSGKDLKEGQYLEAALLAKSETDAFEIPRNILIDNNSLFVVKKGVLELVKINTVFQNRETVVVKGLNNGSVILSKPVPGAYPGMAVKIFRATKKQ